MSDATAREVIVVVPSLKVSGGVREALRLAADLDRGGMPATVLAMWKSPHPMPAEVPVTMLSGWPPRIRRAAFELPALLLRFATWLRKCSRPASAFIFTHYATLPLAWRVANRQRYFYVQDLEWNFLGDGVAASLLRRVVLGFYRSGHVISANPYLSKQLRAHGLEVAMEAPVWADPGFADSAAPRRRTLDVVMVLRKGVHKRLDLYRQFIGLARERGLRVAAITPEDQIAELVGAQVDELLLRPRAAQMKEVYGRSKCFVHLSEHEGFGLPPLEAMGSGCVPVCRDSGGVGAFMRTPGLVEHLLPLGLTVEAFVDHVAGVVADDVAWQHLSALARRRFDDGVQDTADSRRRLAEAMARSTRG